MLRHGNYDYFNKAVMWDSAIADQNIPNSLYLSAKPSWWGDLAWPPVNPLADPSTFNNITIPARERFKGAPPPPQTHIMTPSAGPNGSIESLIDQKKLETAITFR